MSKDKQTSDSAQRGPGFTPINKRRGNDAPSIGNAGNSRSGNSQSNTRNARKAP